ncbi:MAG: TRAP transporter substrate-binding protein [Sphaerochaeta sp.]|jgi:tripartite ATP-independent transporter DctP family solute receptor|uniref:TRAP transporter substrate-binding protein n=1 Tax=Sphaerochaeta sp. TaxID=1972642 RepID=UPI002FCBFE28
MKKIVLTCMLAVLMVTSVFANGQGESKSAEPQKMILKVGLNNPITHPLDQGIVKFGEILKEKSNGRFELQIFPGGQLGKPAVHLQSLQSGVLDMTMIMPATLADYGAEDLKVFTFPYLFDSVEHARAFQKTEAGQKLFDSIQSSGTRMVAIGSYQESARHYFFTKKKVTKVSDMKGLKIRANEGAIALENMAALGCNPVSIAFTELYSALQTGIVDGAEQPLSGFYNNQFQEVAKYMVLDGHELSPNIVLFSEITWNKLSAADQKLIKDAFAESVPYFNELSDSQDSVLMEKILNSGVEVYKPENPAEWRAAVQSVYDKYGAKYASIIEQIRNTTY